MKLIRSVFMILTIFVSVVNCSDQKPKGWKDVISFVNPFATFQPSRISKGHAQYFGAANSLDFEQRKDLLKFISHLQCVRGVMDMPLIIHTIGMFINIPKFQAVAFLEMAFCSINFYYLYELKKFKETIEKENI